MRRDSFGKTPWWKQLLWTLLFALLVMGMLGRRLAPRHRSVPQDGHVAAAPARR